MIIDEYKKEIERTIKYMEDIPEYDFVSANVYGTSSSEWIFKRGFSDIDMKNIDRWSGERIARMLDSEKHEIFTPSPAIHFILALMRQTSLIRLILVCKESGVEEDFIRRKAVRTNG